MNSDQTKQLSLPDILSRLGYEPIKSTKGGNEHWYFSPFRKESEPSFHTSFLGGQWIWNDFGDGGGNIIDFVMRYEGYSKVSEALQFLAQLYQSSPSSPMPNSKKPFSSFQKRHEVEEKQLEFIKAIEIQHPAIIQYLTQTRKIDEVIARKYLKEVWYRNKTNGKEFFAFGMENRSGGYEIRSAQDEYPFKSALIKRDISVIPGFKSGNGVVNVFEGMTDFLSLLTMMNTDNLAGDSIIMHSLSSFEKTKRLLQDQQYKSIHTYLDNNPSGEKYTGNFVELLNEKVKNESFMFLPFEDLNDFLRIN